MEAPNFPYGPTPSKLDAVLRHLISSGLKKVSLDRLEASGLPKTQLSIALSGLRQLGFVDSEGRLTRLAKSYLDDDAQSDTCSRIIRTVYMPLYDVVKSTPNAPEAACAAYLGHLGKGASAQDKILKLFWYFWAKANMADIPVLAKKSRRPASEALHESSATGPINSSGEPEDSYTSGSHTVVTGSDVDAAAIELAHSLARFCQSREKILNLRLSTLSSLQTEIAALQAELARAKDTLDQHLLTYPSLKAVLLAEPTAPQTDHVRISD